MMLGTESLMWITEWIKQFLYTNKYMWLRNVEYEGNVRNNLQFFEEYK